MQDDLIRLFAALHVEAAATETPVDFARVALLNMEISTLGYSFDQPLIDAVAGLPVDQFLGLRTELLALLGSISGADAAHNVLFNGFPYTTPQQRQYLHARLSGFVQNLFGLTESHWTLLSCGHMIDPTVFDLADFGACPICQRQVGEAGRPGLFTKCESPDVAKYPFERLTPLKRLTLADDDFLTAKATLLLGRQSSLSASERALLTVLKSRINVLPATLYRENLPFAFTIAPDAVAAHLASATDVLRIACYLSDPAADLSLTRNTKFKLRTTQKKALLRLLETLEDAAPDMLRHREKFLRLGELLQPGTVKHRVRYPKTAVAFDVLRNASAAIVTFNKVFEQKIRARVVDSDLVRLMQTRPGEFIRHLDVMLRDANDPAIVLDGLRAIAAKVTTRMLFDIQKYLSFRDNRVPQRVFIPKGPANRVRTIDDRRQPIATETLVTAIGVVQQTLLARFRSLPPMGKVYLHPGLRHLLLPFNRRGDSTSSQSVVKGSRYALQDTEVVRMFVHWTGRDVDLSTLYYDAALAPLGFVSFRNLRDDGVIHSGDIQHAPNGATEFIDLHLPTLLGKRVRYVVASVLSYTGETFDSFPAFCGYMERDGLRSGQRFEPQSVTIKMDLTAKTRAMQPFMFDLVDRTVIFLDMTGRSGRYAYVDSSDKSFTEVAQAILSLTERKTTIADVLAAHVGARGQAVMQAAQADRVFLPDVDVDAIAREYVM